ncbi:MAG: AraC family transcriptional regulator [Myxococcales bacterium]|nr:AraC family transcriptional regulator [Myxococcales bacterium]
MTGLVRAGITRGLGAYLARYPGLSIDELMQRAGIGPEELVDPDAMLSLAGCMELLERAVVLTGDAALGLGFAAQLPWKDLGVLGYVVLNSPTVGAAFTHLGRYLAIQQTTGAATLDVGPNLATVTRRVSDPSAATSAQAGELALAMYTRVVRDGTGDPTWAPRAVRFRHPRPASVRAQEQFFAAPVHYGDDHDALVFPAADLRRPMRTADADLLPILLHHADACLASLPAADDLLGAVRRLVVPALGSGEVTMDAIAARLGVSPRSLQRHLQDRGQSFTELVAETRLHLARRYLADLGLSLTECAFLLGYADLSAFSRAFRRWTGQSALAFRRALASSRRSLPDAR